MSGECPLPTSQCPGGEEDSAWCLRALSAHPCGKCSFLSGVGATVIGDVRTSKQEGVGYSTFQWANTWAQAFGITILKSSAGPLEESLLALTHRYYPACRTEGLAVCASFQCATVLSEPGLYRGPAGNIHLLWLKHHSPRFLYVAGWNLFRTPRSKQKEHEHKQSTPSLFKRFQQVKTFTCEFLEILARLTQRN